MSGRITFEHFTDALAEVLHYVDLYATLPSADRPVSQALSLAETVAVERGYTQIGGLTPKGAACWIAGSLGYRLKRRRWQREN